MRIWKIIELFRRVDLNLGKTENSVLPTDERLKAFASDETDHHLLAFIFNTVVTC